ncbi:MAG: DUF2812 domain-containing protein [Clostridiales bacterium]|nr:DUF2812 domain-containing protein [Clostridiales bacterium]
MKKKRFTQEAYEYKQIEGKLEQMAAKGWMLVEIKNNTWYFEKIEPKQLQFNISFHGEEGIFDYPQGDEKKSLRELCEESGWIFAAENMIYQVFYSEKNSEIQPIYTDDQVTFPIMEKIIKRNQLIMLGMIFIFLFHVMRDLSNYHILKDVLKRPSAELPWSFLAVISILILLAFSEYWLSKNWQNIRVGRPMFFYTQTQIWIRNTLSYGLVGLYMFNTLSKLFDYPENIKLTVSILVILGIQIVVLRWVILNFKRVKRSKNKNIAIYIGSGVLLWIVGVFVIFNLIVSGIS